MCLHYSTQELGHLPAVLRVVYLRSSVLAGRCLPAVLTSTCGAFGVYLRWFRLHSAGVGLSIPPVAPADVPAIFHPIIRTSTCGANINYTFFPKKLHFIREADTKCPFDVLSLQREYKIIKKSAMTPKQILKDVYLDLNIRRIANRYFDKPGTWLYQKFDVDNQTDKSNDFSAEEREQLKNALYDLAERIKSAANNL